MKEVTPKLVSLNTITFCYFSQFLWVGNLGVTQQGNFGLGSLMRLQSTCLLQALLGLEYQLPRGLTPPRLPNLCWVLAARLVSSLDGWSVLKTGDLDYPAVWVRGTEAAGLWTWSWNCMPSRALNIVRSKSLNLTHTQRDGNETLPFEGRSIKEIVDVC